jgi:hypothetical protein
LIDYLKILTTDKFLISELYDNPLLKDHSFYQSFKNNLNKEVHEIRQATYTKVYDEIYFCFYVREQSFTKLEVLFKPHYCFNDNQHNANDFNSLDCIKTLTEFRDTFNMPSKEMLILNIEFGINALSPINVKDLITYSVYHEKNEFINSSDNLKFSRISYRYDKYGKANNYKKVKFYSKGIQFPQFTDSNTFRFEIKSKKRSYIKSLGISTYHDLLNPKTYLTLSDNIKKEFSKVLILDIENDRANLNNKENARLNEYLNPFKWIKAIQGSRNLFNKTKIAYINLLNKTGNNIHIILQQIIIEKLDFLLIGCAIFTPPKKVRECAISHIYIMENSTPLPKRICPVTRADISMQRRDSSLLSNTGLKYYQKTDPKYFEMLVNKLLTGRDNKYESSIYSKMSKQIRNRFYSKQFSKILNQVEMFV